MKAVVTGAAGFLGSHLCASLLAQGDDVVGIDCFTDDYDPRRKEAHVARLVDHPGFVLHRLDLSSASLAPLLESVDVVYHLAGQPGVRASWGQDFGRYVRGNIMTTHRLLEAVKEVSLWKVVYASCSSVYGNAECFPTAETLRPQPVSPYGVTKLAAEHLCEVSRAEGVPTVSLRLFTVYGPRQRPDMALSRLVDCAISGQPFLLYGDGEQSRDLTYVDDAVGALRLAAVSPWTGVANIGGGGRVTMNRVMELVSRFARPVDVIRLPVQRGDVRHTAADGTLAREAFGYAPRVQVDEGIAKMVRAAADRLLEEV